MKKTDDLLSIRLRQLMEHHGLVEAELSRRSGLPMITISRLKTGHTDDPRLSTLQKLANFFCVSLSQLVGDEPLILDIRQEARQSFRLPLFYGEQWIHWTDEGVAETVLTNMDFHWIYTDQVSSDKAFALQIDSDLYGETFPKGSIVFIDCALPAKHSPYYVLIVDKRTKRYFLAEKIRMIFEDYLVHPSNRTIHVPLEKDNHQIMGVVSGVKIYWSSHFHTGRTRIL